MWYLPERPSVFVSPERDRIKTNFKRSLNTKDNSTKREGNP